MLKYWFRYFITIFFSFRTPIGLKEYRQASLFLLMTIVALKIIDFVITPIFNQRDIRSHTLEENSKNLWIGYDNVVSVNSYTTNHIEGIVSIIIMLCMTAYFIMCYRRYLDIKQEVKNFTVNCFFIVPLFAYLLSVFYGIHIFHSLLIYYLPIFVAFSFKEYLSDEITERKEWWRKLFARNAKSETSPKNNKGFLKNNIHYIGFFVAVITLLLRNVDDWRYPSRDFLTLMEYFLNPLSIGIFLFYLVDLVRVLYFVDGSDEYKYTDKLTGLSDKVTSLAASLTQGIISNESVSKTIDDIKSTAEKSKEKIKQYDTSKLKDAAEKVKDTVKKLDDY